MNLKDEAMRVMTQFRAYDADGSGLISRAKLSSVLASLHLSAPEVSQLIQMIEESEDPSMPVSYEKFVHYLYDDSFSSSLYMKKQGPGNVIIIGPVGCGRSTQ